jgi:ATP synthase protein I
VAAGPPLKAGKSKWVEYSSVGLMFPASILVGFFIGHFLDLWLKTDPWLTLIFILYGIMAGFYNLFSQVGRRERNK